MWVYWMKSRFEMITEHWSNDNWHGKTDVLREKSNDLLVTTETHVDYCRSKTGDPG
jgi:hypothetical protein